MVLHGPARHATRRCGDMAMPPSARTGRYHVSSWEHSNIVSAKQQLQLASWTGLQGLHMLVIRLGRPPATKTECVPANT